MDVNQSWNRKWQLFTFAVSLCLVSFLRAEVSASGSSCVAGSEWFSECSHCHCPPSGEDPVCEDVGCPVCQPRHRWTTNCKQCKCFRGGRSRCRTVTARDCQDVTEDKGCIKGTTWHDGCNKCFCTENGYTACTKRYCSEETSHFKSPTECQPGQTWMDECKRCLCTEEGFIACEARSCNVPITETKPLEPTHYGPSAMTQPTTTPKPCTPRTQWTDGCRTCMCTDFSEVFCFQKENCDGPTNPTPSKDNNIVPTTPNGHIIPTIKARCRPGDRWMKDCNRCHCNKEGVPTCTGKMCRPGSFSGELIEQERKVGRHEEQNDVEVNERALDQDARHKRDAGRRQSCVGRSEWTESCNVCVCHPDGHPVCTSLACTDVHPWSWKMALGTRIRCQPFQLIENTCNMCVCNSDGNAICTQNQCQGSEQQELKHPTEPKVAVTRQTSNVPESTLKDECRPRTESIIDCTKCICNENSEKICHEIQNCPPQESEEESKHPAPLKLKKRLMTEEEQIKERKRGGRRERARKRLESIGECQPGHEWTVDDGQKSKVKDRSSGGRVRGCPQRCRCGEDGVAICSQVECGSKTQTKEQKPIDGVACTPFTEWMEGCNRCMCSPGGKKLCTKKRCTN